MKKICIYLLLLFGASSFAQVNLVPNPSFEDTVSCPDNSAQIDRAVGWSSYRNSPDYLNACNMWNFGVPANIFGTQLPRTGNAYAGFFSYFRGGVNGRECIGAKLIHPLEMGKKYYVSFYVTRAVNNIVVINIANNKLGVKFTNAPYSYPTPISINNFAHIYTDSVISDTINWVLVSGSFVADSNYQYISIGNFFTDSLTTTLSYDTSAFYAYYFIDDVFLFDSTVTSISEKRNVKINIFPNPARDWIVLEGNGIKSIEIINTLGSKIDFYHMAADVLQNKINISSLRPGVYYLKINMIAEQSYFQKLIIQN